MPFNSTQWKMYILDLETESEAETEWYEVEGQVRDGTCYCMCPEPLMLSGNASDYYSDSSSYFGNFSQYKKRGEY